jgi:CheY-like chemotaxis protein
MNDEVKARAFEPFFSTKGVGRGTGLGLTTSYAIVRDHQGSLDCESRPGVGTTFTLRLPLAAGAEPAPRGAVEDSHPAGVCILLVDDEEAVRSAISQLLLAHGLRVLTAASGAEALAQLVANPGVDAILLDRSMPDASGESFVPRIREIAARARILMFSGQTIDPRTAAIFDGVVQKPVRGSELLAAVRKALSEPARGTR